MSTTQHSSQRTRKTYDLYNTGATLREVGERFGLTGERVRQIFRSAGLSTRSITETQSLRHDHLVEEQGDQIAAAFRRHKDVGEVAERLKVPHTLVKEIVVSRFPPRERRRPRRPIPPKYPDSEMVAFLQEASATKDGPLSIEDYRRYAERRSTDDGRSWPSIYTFIRRFGSWRKALIRASLPVNSSGPSSIKPKFSKQDCIDALGEAARTLAEPPTITAYDELARNSNGRLPSALTVKNRLGSWYSALARAGL